MRNPNFMYAPVAYVLQSGYALADGPAGRPGRGNPTWQSHDGAASHYALCQAILCTMERMERKAIQLTLADDIQTDGDDKRRDSRV
jgi:hypothetical protein